MTQRNGAVEVVNSSFTIKTGTILRGPFSSLGVSCSCAVAGDGIRLSFEPLNDEPLPPMALLLTGNGPKGNTLTRRVGHNPLFLPEKTSAVLKVRRQSALTLMAKVYHDGSAIAILHISNRRFVSVEAIPA